MYSENTFISVWLDYIHNTLFINGLGYIWASQSADMNVNLLKVTVKQRLLSQFEQTWHKTVNNSSKCFLYKHYKEKLEFESFLSNVPRNLIKYIVKFRTCNHNLAIEMGRYNNVVRNQRICDLCTSGSLRDE